MDHHTFRALLCEGPQLSLLDAIDNGQDHQAVVTLLEAELQRSSSRLQRLKEHRNALTSPMYRMHPEILSNIFYIYAQDNNELYDLRWTRLLFVCRRWHDIAINILKLWSFIDVGPTLETTPYGGGSDKQEREARDVRRIELQRSRAALSPLTIRMGLYSHLSEAKLAYTSLFWHSSSLFSLSVSGDNVYVDKIIRILASQTHGILRTLQLHCFLDSDPSVSAGMQSSLEAALKTNTPKLSHLAITGLPFDWSLIQGLRSLHIAYMNNIPLSFTLQNTIDALCRCPRLESLAIKLPSGSLSEIALSSAAVPLPCIDAIVLSASTEVCTQLLQALHIPSSTKLITSHIDGADDATLPPLVSCIGSHASRDDSPVIRSIAMTFTRIPAMIDDEEFGVPNESQLGIFGQTSHVRIERGLVHRWFYTWNMLDRHRFPHIGIESRIPVASEAQVLRSALQSWPLSSATRVDFRLADSEFSLDHLDIVFAELPGITTVVVRPQSRAVQALLDILHRQLHQHGRRVLANIIFDCAGVFHHRTHAVVNDTPPPTGVLARRTIMRTLLYCAEAARLGVPMSTVEIVNEPHEVRDRLIGHVEEVDWSELYEHLDDGLVYEGVMHSRKLALDETEWDSSVS